MCLKTQRTPRASRLISKGENWGADLAFVRWAGDSLRDAATARVELEKAVFELCVAVAQRGVQGGVVCVQGRKLCGHRGRCRDRAATGGAVGGCKRAAERGRAELRREIVGGARLLEPGRAGEYTLVRDSPLFFFKSTARVNRVRSGETGATWLDGDTYTAVEKSRGRNLRTRASSPASFTFQIQRNFQRSPTRADSASLGSGRWTVF